MSGVAAPPATAVQLQFPHAAQGSSCFSVSTAAAGARLRPQTPGRGRPGMGLSRLGTSSSAGPPRLPASGVRPPPEVPTPRAPAPRAFPPAGPTSCATVAGRPGGEERKSVRARVAKFQLCAELRGIKERAGPSGSNTWEGAGPRGGSNTWEGAGPRGEQHVGGGGAAATGTLLTFSPASRLLRTPGLYFSFPESRRAD